MIKPTRTMGLLSLCLVTAVLAVASRNAQAQIDMETYGPAIRGAVAGAASDQIDLWVAGISEKASGLGGFMENYGPAIRGAAGTSAAGIPLGWDKVGSGMVLALQDGFDEARTGVGPLRIVFKVVDDPDDEKNAGGSQIVFSFVEPPDFEHPLSAEQPTAAVVVLFLLF